MRGINTQTRKIRKKVFEEVARAAYSGGDNASISHELEEIPYKITPSDVQHAKEYINLFLKTILNYFQLHKF